jgi:hypothetical protein
MDFHANTPRRFRAAFETLLCQKLFRMLAYKTGEITAELILTGRRWISTFSAGPKDRPCRSEARAS